MDIAVTHEPDHHRYVITVDGAKAGHSGYNDADGVRAIMHTWVDEEFEGHGVGSELIVGALRDIRDSGLQVLPMCPFVPHVLKENPEFINLVPEDVRDRYGLND